jgi:phage/plasmid-like protein (TIGR03299 family)
MSKETSQWLNQNVLVGMTDKRGSAWHYKASEQGAEPNHYAGAVPIEDVNRRLFHWKALEVPMWIDVPLGIIDNTEQQIEVPNKKAIVRSDTFDVLGVHSGSYASHQYDEWLLKSVSNILDDDLVIGSAGLLKNGAIAWVQVEMPENSKVADVEFRPNLLATTSFNGSISTTYKRTVTIVVCDNTREIALREDSEQIKIRHTANSAVRLDNARNALNIVHQLEDAFGKEIAQLLDTAFTDQQFEKFLTKLILVKDTESKQALTRSDNLKSEFLTLWREDERVSPWRGTAFGVMQAVNTHRQHMRSTRKGNLIVERTMLESLNGKLERLDKRALNIIHSMS